MNKYTIYCTTNQAIKAFEHGAPISIIKSRRTKDTVISDDVIEYDDNTFTYIVCPTAEQMIGWLEERGILIDINPINGLHFYWMLRTKELDEGSNKYMWECQYTTPERDIEYPSRKEATIAAVDAALDYLIQKKERDNE